jgi:predicted TPR repeat methyltransferase
VSIPDTFDHARQHHQAGRLAEAEAIYREILAAEPRHADALHLLGVIAGQTGRKEEAVDFIRQAVALRPNHPEMHKNLGVALNAAGRTDEAIAAYRQAVTLKPDYAEAHRNLGNALYVQGWLDEAIEAYHQAVALDASQPEVRNNLGNALHKTGRHDEAIAEYRAALRLRPGFATASNNLGIALKSAGRADEAIAAYRDAIATKPDYADAFGNLAHALREQGRTAEAVAAYRSAIELKPDSPEWRHVLAALTGDQSSSSTPASYVRNLFDPYAGEFDAHLVEQLGYRVPELFLESITAIAPDRRFDILDLGCGTGLCGVQFRAIAKVLTGVDLSPAMIAKAAEKDIYDRLITGDIAGAMRDQEASFDLILAGDLFVYVGDLRDAFAAAARTLRDGGLFAFSLERHDGEGFVLHSKVRFAHSLAYVRELSRTHHFSEVLVREIAVRKSGADDIPGWIVLLRKPSAPAAE